MQNLMFLSKQMCVNSSGDPIIKYVGIRNTSLLCWNNNSYSRCIQAPNGSLVAYNDQGKQNLAKATQESSGAIAENAVGLNKKPRKERRKIGKLPKKQMIEKN